jgi:hypothetical protein
MSKQILNPNRSSLSGDNLLKLDPTPNNASLLEEDQISGEDTHIFPTGHQVRINLDGQSIEVSDIHGKLQVQINITADGPQISLNGGELNLLKTLPWNAILFGLIPKKIPKLLPKDM